MRRWGHLAPLSGRKIRLAERKGTGEHQLRFYYGVEIRLEKIYDEHKSVANRNLRGFFGSLFPTGRNQQTQHGLERQDKTRRTSALRDGQKLPEC
jgi:hypothetical protein